MNKELLSLIMKRLYIFKKCFNSSVPPLSFADRDTFTCNGIHDCPDNFLCTAEEVKLFSKHWMPLNQLVQMGYQQEC